MICCNNKSPCGAKKKTWMKHWANQLKTAVNNDISTNSQDDGIVNLYFAEHILFENSVNTDQLASHKPADQDPCCFPLCFRGVKFPNKLLALHVPNFSLRCVN